MVEINAYWSWEIPDEIKGVAVVADVFAASSNITSFVSKSIRRLFIANETTVDAVMKEYPKALVIGESAKKDLAFFNYSNAPSECMYAPVEGKTIIYMSNNGTRAIESAFTSGAGTVLVLSFLNQRAVAKWIRNKMIKNLNLIASGESSFLDPQEVADMECVRLLERILKHRKLMWESVKRKVDAYIKEYYPERVYGKSFPLVMRLNHFPVVPVCKFIREGLIEVKLAN